MIDVSHVPEPTIGEEVIVISEDPKSPISLEKNAEAIGTISYDILVHMNKEMYRKCA
jgi:alanine racemase